MPSKNSVITLICSIIFILCNTDINDTVTSSAEHSYTLPVVSPPQFSALLHFEKFRGTQSTAIMSLALHLLRVSTLLEGGRSV